MEYSDGHDSIEPGGNISDGHTDLGSATYDSDGDGVADSVIVGDEQYTHVITDHDGDGSADQITTYDSHGDEVDSKSLGDSDTGQHTPDDGGSDGDDGGSTDGGSTDGGSTDGGSTDGGSTDSGGGGGSTDSGGDGGAADAGASGTITVVDDQGRTVEVGPATVDMDNNGEPDTAVVHNDDGSTVGYTDRNGDGAADQITSITADRQVTIMVSDGSGNWSVAAKGHLDDNGEFVEDDGSGSGSGSGSAGGSGSTGGADGDYLTADGTADGTADAAGTTGPVEISYTDADGHSYQLGAPTADFNNDGTPDTVVTTLDNGTVVGYSDVDGDGLTDQVTQIDPDGTVTIGVPDGNGGWEQAATGTLGPDGEFVPSAGVTV